MANGTTPGSMTSDVMEATESQPIDSKLIPMPSVNGPTNSEIISKPSLQWSRWQELPDSTSIYSPAAVSASPNRIDVFRIGIDSKMYYSWWDGSKWNGWKPLEGKIFTSAPTAISPSSNRIDVFGISTDKQVYRQTWNGSKWNEQWESLGGVCIHGLAATSWGANRIDLFAVGTNSCLYHKWWDGSGWNGWEPLKLKNLIEWEKSSTTIYAPAAVASDSNRIDLFAVGIDNYIYHAWWDGEEWIGWEKVDGPCIQGIAVASRGKNLLDLFTIGTDVEGTDNHLYHCTWDGSKWGNWENLGGACISAPVVVARGANRLNTFVIGTQNKIWQKSWEKESSTDVGVQDYKSKNYTHVQYIAYQVPTFGKIVHSGDDLTDTAIDKKIKGMLTDDDERRRVKRLYDVVMAAKGQDKVDSSDTTLKIFVAPEFYFKSSKTEAKLFGYSYSFNTMQNIMECLHVLFKENAELANWLIIPGSIVSMLPGRGWARAILPKVGSGSIYENDPKDMSYLNTVPAIKGGDPEAPLTYVHKRLISHIDGSPFAGNLFDNPFAIRNDPLYNTEDLLGSWSENKANIFKVDNITFGLEVCLDHALEVLKDICQIWKEQEEQEKERLNKKGKEYEVKGLPDIDIHLITSCGMAIDPKNVMARKNGYVAICDGINNSQPRTQMKKIKNHSLTDGATFTDADIAQVGVYNLPVSLQLNVADSDPRSQVKPQSLVFYNTVAL